MVKIVATRCHILRLKCPKFDFGWGSAPDPAKGAQVQYSPRPHNWILKVLLIRGGKGKENRGCKGGRKEKGTGEGERGRREARGSLGWGKKGGKGNGGDKSPAWSSQDLGSTGDDVISDVI